MKIVQDGGDPMNVFRDPRNGNERIDLPVNVLPGPVTPRTASPRRTTTG